MAHLAKNIDALIEEGGEITLARLPPFDCVATAEDGSNCLAMLVRRDGETLNQLMRRLDRAIHLAWTEDWFTDEVNGRASDRSYPTSRGPSPHAYVSEGLLILAADHSALSEYQPPRCGGRYGDPATLRRKVIEAARALRRAADSSVVSDDLPLCGASDSRFFQPHMTNVSQLVDAPPDITCSNKEPALRRLLPFGAVINAVHSPRTTGDSE